MLEFKTHSAKSFADLVAKTVRDSKPQHFAQMQVYMHLTGLTRAMYLAVNKDTDDLYVERIEHDQEFAERLLEKAGRIIFAPVPPDRLSNDPSWYLCRFCDHAALCHQAGAAAVNCRTCLHATPVMGGWHCQRQDCSLTEADQRQACRRHLYLPPLVPAEQIDAGEDWVLYRCPDGSTWRDSGFNKFADTAGVSA